MIEKLSPSSIREFCVDQQSFYKKYVLYIKSPFDSSSALVGKVVHKRLEHLNKKSPTDPLSVLLEQEKSGSMVSYKKGEDDTKLIKKAQNALDAYQEMGETGSPIMVEQKITADVAPYGIEFDLPITCRVDVVKAVDNDIVVVDYKTCEKHNTMASPAYFIQAWLNMLCVEKVLSQRPLKTEFIELKTTKNKDKGKPHYNIVSVPYPTEEEVLVLSELIHRISETCKGRNLLIHGKGIPNPYDSMGGKRSWEEFYQSVITE